VIGVAAMVAIVSIGEGAQASVNDRLGGLGADLITVSPGAQRASGGFRTGGDFGGGEGSSSSTISSKVKNLTNRDVQIIKTIEGVKFVNGIVSGRASLTYLAETSSISVQGVDTMAWQNMVTTPLESGRYLNSGDTNEKVIVIGNRIATKNFKQPLVVNRVVTIYMANYPPQTFKIVGILQSSGAGDDNVVFMPSLAARDVLNLGPDKIDSIILKVENTDNVDLIVNETDARLMLSRHVTTKTKDYSITSAKAIQANIQSITQTFTIFLAAIAGVSLLVGAVGIANTMFTSVLEKTREIGVMKAIGAKNLDIMLIFLMNSGLVGLVGGLIGIGLGAAISSLLPNLIGMSIGPGIKLKTLIPTSLLIQSITGSILIGMVAGAIPAYRASKLKPVDALRYE